MQMIILTKKNFFLKFNNDNFNSKNIKLKFFDIKIKKFKKKKINHYI